MTDKSSDQYSRNATKKRGTVADYLAIARFDHSVKHIFILPGIVLAYLLRGTSKFDWANVVLGLAAAICIASGNYVINEWLDSESDKFHPTKSKRVAVIRELSGFLVSVEWIVFVIIGLGCAALASKTMALIAILFALQGIFYNVKPLRLKDKPYFDVISESVNNPLRLMIGWAMVDPMTLPPSSIILSFWLGGAFLMAAKRLSEYREIAGVHGKELLTSYRTSFAGYTEVSLTISCFVYAMLSSFFLAIFLIKYRVEYILVMPWVTILFAHYLAISMKTGSSAQSPEKLYRERGLVFLVVLFVITFLFATLVNVPMLAVLVEQKYIGLQ